MTRVRRSLVVLAAAVCAVAGIAVSAAPAQADVDTCAQVHLGPAAATGGDTGYFTARLAAGARADERLLVANPARTTCTVALSAAVGRTAVNSGDTYVEASGTWVHGLPATVVLAPGERREVPFHVTVPAGTAAGQHLYGVIGRPAEGSTAPASGAVSVHVATRVAIGVAVTVPGAAAPAIAVPSVSTRTEGVSADLRITERNTGATWEHPAGSVEVEADGRTLRIPVDSNTVLPGDAATLTVAATDVPTGTWPVTVRLRYASGSRTAVWHGSLPFAPPQVTRKGDVLTVTPAGQDWMPVAFAAAVGLLLVALAAIVALVLRRRRTPSAVSA